MNRQLIKMLTVGAVLGAALFFLPFFVLKVLVVFVLFGLVFRIFGRYRGYRGGYRGPYGWAFADKIRGMDDAEYASFKERMSRGRCGHRYSQGNELTKTDEA